jgi:heme/copper-type cytochrome/quinol oxidase subunit 2
MVCLSVPTYLGLFHKELGIKKVTFEKGKPATTTFTAMRSGTYEFRCANFCVGHGTMKGQIIVSPQAF